MGAGTVAVEAIGTTTTMMTATGIATIGASPGPAAGAIELFILLCLCENFEFFCPIIII